MNILPLEQQTQVIAALTEGVSIRATERLTGIHRDTTCAWAFASDGAVMHSMTA